MVLLNVSSRFDHCRNLMFDLDIRYVYGWTVLGRISNAWCSTIRRWDLKCKSFICISTVRNRSSSSNEFRSGLLVSPFSLRLNLNQHSMRDASLFSFVDRQDLRVTCEVSSYPRSTLQFIFNHQPLLPLDETVDCISEDLAIIPLGKSMCLSQTNWRIRVRISTVIHLRNEHDGQTLTCALRDFPYGNAWNSSLGVQFIRKAGEKWKESRTILCSLDGNWTQMRKSASGSKPVY